MSNRKKPKALKDRLAAAKPAERSVDVCLRGDLGAEHDRLNAELKRVRQGITGTLGSQAQEAEIAARLTAIEAEMADEMLTLTVRALNRSAWRELVQKHPAREGNLGDRAIGANFQALMDEAIPACTVQPDLDEEDWARLNEVMSSGDYDRLATAVWEVNREGGDIPKSLLASRVMIEHSDAPK